MDSQGKGLIKALENWAKRVTEGYRDVNVRDMSSSFRDGLAFCAIIHHYRPDLIDFNSLSKENILENNQIAFSVAEKQLGVPALLDAEDMVKYSRPDRLSIITYLSQLHNCFENQNKVRSGFKRIQSNAVSPPSKILASEPQLLTARRIEVCQVCNNRVFILERLIVDRKLYHTACFRCWKCKALLNPGAYVESDTPGQYECTVCLPEEKLNSIDTDDTNSHSSLEEKNNSLQNSVPQPLHPVQNNHVSPLSESVTRARTSFLQRSLTPKSNDATKVPSSKLDVSLTTYDRSISPLAKEDLPRNGVSVKDKISVFESSRNSSLNSLKFEEPLPSKKNTETSISISKTDNLLNKSPRPTARLSLLSSAISNKDDITQKVSNEKSFVNSNLNEKDNISNCDSNDISKDFSSNCVEVSSSSDKSSCDNVTVKSIASEVLAVDNVSLAQNVSNNSEPLTKEPEKIKMLGVRKTDLKTSSDIFQNKFQPLKLTIPTINTSIKNEPVTLPTTSVHTSPDSVRTVEIAQIKPTYSRTLARPLSYTSLSSRDKSSNVVENSSPSILNNNTLRRNSFDSDSKKTNDLFSSSVRSEVSLNNSSPSLETKTYQNSSNNVNDINKLKINKVSDVPNSTINSSLSSSNIRKITPTPSIRKSLEMKDTGLQKDFGESKFKSEVPAVKNLLTSTINLKLQETKISDASPSNILPQKDTTDSSPKGLPAIAVPVKEEAAKSYPDDLNPFGDDEVEEEYPDDLNPFGDDEENNEDTQITPKVFEGVSADNYDESKNPFASDEEEAETSAYTPSPKPQNSQNNSPFGTLSSMSSPTGSLRGTTKKRKAPKPPKVTDIFPNAATDSEGDVSFNSMRSSPAVSRKVLQTPSPKLRKNKPAPPPPPVASPRQISQNDVTASVKQAKDTENMKLKSSAKEPGKKKKRPAPPVPIPMRKDKKKIPLKEIMREMKEIELKQREFEKQGREIELLIRDRDKDEEPSVEEEEYIMQLFELVNQKNALFRRQAELMYIKRSQRLEEQQEELEKQIRLLMSKPDNEKTEDDKIKEEELIYELTDIVDQRNSIIDSIEMDRRRELEEDVSVQEQIEMKNGDLPIAAEIKEKSKEKKKKDKKKKEKKKDKHHENGDSGKSTLKRKLFK